MNEPAQVWRCAIPGCDTIALCEELDGDKCPRCGSEDVFPALDGLWDRPETTNRAFVWDGPCVHGRNLPLLRALLTGMSEGEETTRAFLDGMAVLMGAWMDEERGR